MLRRTTLLLPLLAVLALAGSSPDRVGAQITASESASVTQDISGTEFEIRYSRPSLRDRGEPFGDIVAFDDTWTGGANAATTFRTSKDVVLGGTEVPAGRYSVWLEVVDGPEWRVMLHSDTTLFHSPHQPIDEEEQIVLDASRERGEELRQTLSWSFEDVAWDGATLTLAWGRERIRMPLEVDAGITLTVSEEEAAAYVGAWRVDDSGSRMSAERIEEMLSDPDVQEASRRYAEAMRDIPVEREVEIYHDARTGRLFRTDAPWAELWSWFTGMGEGDPTFELLVPRAEGIFAPTTAVGGELMSFNPDFANFMEFTAFDESGRATAFEVRDGDDEIVMTGERIGG